MPILASLPRPVTTHPAWCDTPSCTAERDRDGSVLVAHSARIEAAAGVYVLLAQCEFISAAGVTAEAPTISISEGQLLGFSPQVAESVQRALRLAVALTSGATA